MSFWQIEPDEYFRRLNCKPQEFKERLHLPNVDRLQKIVPLRQIESIEALIPIRLDLLLCMLRKIQTLDRQLPFEKISEIKMVKMDPRQLKIGQKFVYRENYQALLEGIPGIFHQFLINNGGLSDLGAYFIFGKDESGNYALACYIPPLVEKHGTDLIVMDGIHRNYIAKQAGMTINAILIDGVSLPFPCAVEDWSQIKVIPLSYKPKELAGRYFSLNKGLFRDLKHLGIDG